MLTGLDGLKYWPDKVKQSQKGWIGKRIDIQVPVNIKGSNYIVVAKEE